MYILSTGEEAQAEASPTAAIIESQSVTEKGGPALIRTAFAASKGGRLKR
jgi:hypothetical protein